MRLFTISTVFAAMLFSVSASAQQEQQPDPPVGVQPEQGVQTVPPDQGAGTGTAVGDGEVGPVQPPSELGLGLTKPPQTGGEVPQIRQGGGG